MAAPSDAPPTEDASTPRRRWTAGRLLAIAAAVFVLGMWAYVLAYHVSGRWRGETPGRIADPAFAEQAEVVCERSLSRVDQLPPAFSATSATERADTIEASNAILEEMLVELDGLAPLAGADQPLVEEWLDDWSTFVDDRHDYARRLRDDPEARFYVTQRDADQRQITVGIDRLAVVNGMESCKALNDVG